LHLGGKCCQSLPLRFCEHSFIISGGCSGAVHRVGIDGSVMGRIDFPPGVILGDIRRIEDDCFAVEFMNRIAIIDREFRLVDDTN
jgi:hypothetical protein